MGPSRQDWSKKPLPDHVSSTVDQFSSDMKRRFGQRAEVYGKFNGATRAVTRTRWCRSMVEICLCIVENHSVNKLFNRDQNPF